MRAKILVAAAAATLGAAIAVPAIGQPGSPQGGTGGPVKCANGTVTWTPSNLWPPNHKLQTVTITYHGDGDGDTATIAITGWDSNEIVGGQELPGSGSPHQPTPDVVPGAPGSGPDNSDVTTTAQVRSERSGTGDGRTYTIHVQCTESMDMDSGTADVVVTVPHDQRPTS